MPRKVLRAAREQRLRSCVRALMGMTAGLVGIVNMLSLIVPRPNWALLFGDWPISAYHNFNKLTVIIGFLLLMLSYGVIRGKRQAWRATVLLLLILAFLYVLHSGPLLITLLSLGLLTLLVFFSQDFCAKSDPPSVWRGYLALASGLSIVVLYTVGGFLAFHNRFELVFERFDIDDFINLLLTHAHMRYFIPDPQAMLFGHVIPLLCLCAVLYGAVSILRPVAAVLHPDEQERQRASALTRLYGRNSISYFALSAEKSYFFSASGQSFISYVLEGNVAVVAGDPIGPTEELAQVIEQFTSFCREQDWTIVFWQVLDTTIDLYRAAGMHTLKIGEDAVIDTQTFTLAGKAMANVRTSAKRAEKEGLQVVFYRGRVPNAEHLAQMEQISHAWLASKGGTEMGFSLGCFDPRSDDEQVYALAIDGRHRVHAFVSFVPVHGRNGWGLDLMRRSECTACGTMELLLVRSIEYFKKSGAEMVSLGLAPLSNANNTGENFLENSLDFLTSHFGDSNKNQALFRFKKKFQPCWESRYLVFSSTLRLPTIGWAIYRAHQHNASLLTALRHSLKEWQETYHATIYIPSSNHLCFARFSAQRNRTLQSGQHRQPNFDNH
ncbi:MAG: DUF2156 domain-containing protein [Ktedonobacteraceae bacterium]|nr:DUF2156 domain-containing protein [Ktedonobacteraceae bacterium]